MYNKLSLVVIFREHFSSYKDDIQAHNPIWDYILFIYSPICVSFMIVFLLGLNLRTEVISSLLTIFAILIPLMFTSIISVHDTMQNLVIRESQNKKYTTHYKNLITKYKQLSSNVAFVIIGSLFELVMLLMYFGKSISLFSGSSSTKLFLIKGIYDSIVISLLIIIILHLFYIVKRLYLLFNANPDMDTYTKTNVEDKSSS